MQLSNRELFILKIYSMIENKALMDKDGKESPTPDEMIQFMDMLRKTQHPRQSFDFMVDIIEAVVLIQDQQVETGKFIVKQMKNKRHGKSNNRTTS